MPVDAALRASQRSAAQVHLELSEGLGGLATVASVAPLLGLFAAVEGIPASFRGCGGEKWACLSAAIHSISYALCPIPLGLFVGLTALALHRLLSGCVATFDVEMRSACLDLANELSRRRAGWVTTGSAAELGSVASQGDSGTLNTWTVAVLFAASCTR